MDVGLCSLAFEVCGCGDDTLPTYMSLRYTGLFGAVNPLRHVERDAAANGNEL